MSALSKSLMNEVWRLLLRLSARRRWQLAGYFVLMLVGAGSELATLGAVLPFLAVLTEPSLSSKYPTVQRLLYLAGWHKDSILIPATILFATVAVCAGAIRVLLSWVG